MGGECVDQNIQVISQGSKRLGELRNIYMCILVRESIRNFIRMIDVPMSWPFTYNAQDATATSTNVTSTNALSSPSLTAGQETHATLYSVIVTHYGSNQILSVLAEPHCHPAGCHQRCGTARLRRSPQQSVFLHLINPHSFCAICNVWRVLQGTS